MTTYKLFERTWYNWRLAKKRVQGLIEDSASYQLLCWVDSLVLRNLLLRQHQNVSPSPILPSPVYPGDPPLR